LADELNTQIKNGKAPTIVDVRGGDEFIGPLGHILSVLNIPLSERPRRLTEINARMDQPVILVCKTDKRSAQAAKFLEGSTLSRSSCPAWRHGSVESKWF